MFVSFERGAVYIPILLRGLTGWPVNMLMMCAIVAKNRTININMINL